MSSDKICYPENDMTISSTIPLDGFDPSIHNLRIAPREATVAVAASLGGVEGIRTERVIQSPRAVELILRFICSCSPPVIYNLTLLSEGQWSGEKYDVKPHGYAYGHRSWSSPKLNLFECTLSLSTRIRG